mmetsp:Transcript_22324/g.37997  ORF Transcript_22324/g.37997 Transcript_22324/m.37997 type:complete len:367 (-) Transcript_22324:51-1151(-)
MMQVSSNPQSNGSGGDPDVIPVVDDNEQRRYVSPSNPFEMLYGASFLHQDYRKMMGGGDKRSRSRQGAVSTSGIKPMLQIDEGEEEDENGVSSSHSERGVGAWLRSLTSKMDCTKGEKNEVTNQDHPFVYRDFPRHDGTPCLMYKSNHDSNPSSSIISSLPSQMPPQFTYDADLLPSNDNFGSSMHSLKSADSHTSIDNFVDTLEALMRMKHKQYQERAKMEQERLERKRRRDAERAASRNTAQTGVGSIPPEAPSVAVSSESLVVGSHDNGDVVTSEPESSEVPHYDDGEPAMEGSNENLPPTPEQSPPPVQTTTISVPAIGAPISPTNVADTPGLEVELEKGEQDPVGILDSEDDPLVQDAVFA